MPIYEYECDKGHHFEVTQRISEDRLDTCIKCDAPAERLISASSFVLKGGGWYAQGYNAASSAGEASSAPIVSESKSATEAGAIKTPADTSSSSGSAPASSGGDD